MGLLDYEGLACGWCESTNIGMIPLATVSVSGPALMFPLAYCRDCGAPFVPPPEVIEEKRKEWGDAIREGARKVAAKVTLPPKKAPAPPPEKKSVRPACEKCGKKMSLDNTSEARYTTFRLWKCRCGHTWLEKRLTTEGLISLPLGDFEEDPDPLDPDDIPEDDP